MIFHGWCETPVWHSFPECMHIGRQVQSGPETVQFRRIVVVRYVTRCVRPGDVIPHRGSGQLRVLCMVLEQPEIRDPVGIRLATGVIPGFLGMTGERRWHVARWKA